MPIVEVHVIQGYDPATKQRLARLLTDSVRTILPAPPEAVTVLIKDHAPENYMRGRSSRQPAPPLPDAGETVRAYLAEMEARDLDAARARLSPEFTMTFPGTAPMRTLEELIAWARPRYRFVIKTIEGIDTCPGPEATVVWVRGTLYGEWPDGTPFEGIRYTDRFEVAGDVILKQDVWNDIAEVRP